MSIAEKFIDAVELLATQSVKRADYDKTIQAQIISCEDATIGKYKCRYQDAIIYAYAENPDITYSEKALVYISVPGNDMSKEKIIRGTAKKLGINYISQAQGDQAYDINGNNCVTTNGTFYLNTKYNNYRYVLYKANSDQSTDKVLLNIPSIEQYIRTSSSLIAGATFKTSIQPDKQYQGHYGITYNLLFLDNVSDQKVIRSYTVDENSMIDNPYRLVYPTRQYQIFDIDGPNFIRIESIQIFNRDFPNATETTDEILNSGDIEITNLQFFGAIRMSQGEINGVAISFYTPMGTFFTGSDDEKNYRTITAQVRVKGKLASAAQNIPFYWGIEDVRVSSGNQYYNTYLGRGWKCLNDKNVIQTKMIPVDNALFIIENTLQDYYYYKDKNNKVYIGIKADESEEYTYRFMTKQDYDTLVQNEYNDNLYQIFYQENNVVEWIPSKDTYIFNKEDATAQENKLKVAIVYDGTVITKQIVIKNLGDKPKITIESSDGTQFYYDVGHPTLTCKVNGEEKLQYNYHWAYEDNTGFFDILQTTEDLNKSYNDNLIQYQQLLNDINQGIKFANAEEKNLKDLEDILKNDDYNQRVQGNKIYNVQIRNITSFRTFKCSVYNEKDIYLGTAAITLTNKLQGEDLYSLVINNGTVTFQYNEEGIAPTSKSLQVPQQIQALNFTVYDNLGNPIDSNVFTKDPECEAIWRIPINSNTMLINTNETDDNTIIVPKEYAQYKNRLNLTYGIANGYDIRKQDNQIELRVNYKGMNLIAKTNFTFVKQGEPGTNGTQYIVKLIPNVKSSQSIPLFPMVTNVNNLQYILNYRLPTGEITDRKESIILPDTSYQLFKAQLWHNGEKIWEGISSQQGEQSKPVLVNWQILTNPSYSNSVFSVVDGGYGKIKFNNKKLQTLITQENIPSFTNIIKCTIKWENKSYYGTIPIAIAYVYNGNYRISLKDYTGFRYVTYTSDGVLPKYDNSHPFEFICEEKINGIWEDISLVSGDHEVIEYNVASNNNKMLRILLSDTYRKNVLKNQWQARPAERDDGSHINIGICCTCIQKIRGVDTIIGKILIPIHYLLNKYGMSHINEWDGNSIQVNNEGGYILSPQIGAGAKNEDNTFTGVLMGEVRTKDKSDIGLLGYSSGDRTFFLNSQNGSAIFGKNNGGQIIIDPITQPDEVTLDDGMVVEVPRNRALFYSDGFWKKYNENGLPINYHSTNEAGEGMLIDLTTPEIRFGNGHFKVDSSGNLYAAGGGQIAGWTIGTSILTGGDLKLNSNGSIYSNNHTSLINTSNGFFMSADGLSIGNKFKVNNTGQVYIGAGATENGGTKTGPYWTIDGTTNNSYIGYNKDVFESAGTGEQSGSNVYIGTDGISLSNKFSVNSSGNLKAYSGTIGGWSIENTQLKAKNLLLKSSGDIQTNNYNSTKNTGWKISQDGTVDFNSGTIGGWTINGTTLKAGNITLDSNGSMTGNGWSISTGGVAYFQKIHGNVPSGYTFTLNGTLGGSGNLDKNAGLSGSGMRLGGSKIGSYINPRGVSAGGGKTLQGHFDTLYADKAEFNELKAKVASVGNLNVMSKLSYRGHSASWSSMVSDINYSSGSKQLTISYRYAITAGNAGGKGISLSSLA